MFQFPELFGSPYILPAILAVVVLLLVLLLLMMRNRRKAIADNQSGTSGEKAAKAGKAPKAAKAPREAKKARKRVKSGEPQPGRIVPEQEGGAPAFLAGPRLGSDEPNLGPAAEAEGSWDSPQAGDYQAGPGVPAAEGPEEGLLGATALGASGPLGFASGIPVGVASLPNDDPLQATLLDILQGWGDLSDEDTGRLRIFKQDKVIAAISALELPKELRNSDHSRNRLSQLRLYANSLRESGSAAKVEAEFAAMAAETAAPVQSAEPQASPPLTGEEELPLEDDLAAGRERAIDEAWGTGTGKELWGTDAALALWGGEAPQTAGAEGSDLLQTPQTEVNITWEPGEPTAPQAEAPGVQVSSADGSTPWSDSEATTAAAAAAFWAATEQAAPAGVSQAEAPSAPASAAPPEAQEEPEPDISVAAEELPVVEEVTELLEAEPVEAVVSPEEAFADAEAPLTAVPQADAYPTGLSEKIRTAEDIAALPPGERAKMLVFLEPQELAKVFAAADSVELKKAVIDTLEHTGTPASLDVLHRCLDDPDPAVQLYALEAADRLLGGTR